MNRKARRTFDSLMRRRKLAYMAFLPALFGTSDVEFARQTFPERF